MKSKVLLTTLGLVLANGYAYAGETIGVKTTVAAGCQISANDFIFGDIGIGSTTKAPGEMRATCSNKTLVTLSGQMPTSPNKIGSSGSTTYYGNGGIKLTSADINNSDVLWAMISAERTVGEGILSQFGYYTELNWGNGYLRFFTSSGRSDGSGKPLIFKMEARITTSTTLNTTHTYRAKADNYSAPYTITATF